MNYAEQIHRLAAPHGAAVITTAAAAEIAAQADAEIKQLRAQLATLVDAAIPFANAHFPDERELLGDADYLALNRAVMAADSKDGQTEPTAPNAPQPDPLIDTIKRAFITCESAPPTYRVILQFPTLSEAQSAHGVICKAVDNCLLQTTAPQPDHIADPDKMIQPEASKADPDQWEVAKVFVLSACPSTFVEFGGIGLGWAICVTTSDYARSKLTRWQASTEAAWLDAALNIAKGKVVNQYPDAVSYMFDGRVTIRDNETGNYFALGTGLTEIFAWIDAARRLGGWEWLILGTKNALILVGNKPRKRC